MNNKKNKEDLPKKSYYILEVNGLMPVQVNFRVLAENEEEAYKIFDTRPDQATPMGQPKPMPGKIIPKKICIRNSVSALITWMRNF